METRYLKVFGVELLSGLLPEQERDAADMATTNTGGGDAGGEGV